MDTKHLTQWLHTVIIKCYLLSQFPPHFLLSLFGTDTSIHSNPLLHPITSNLLPKTVCSTLLLSFRLWCIQHILNICLMPNTFLGTKDSEMNTYQSLVISSVQSLSRIWLSATPWTAARQASRSISSSWSLLKLKSIKSMMPSKPSHPLLSPSPSAFNLSQHQGLFQGVSSLHQVAKELKFQLQHQSFQWIFRADFLEDWLVWSPCSLRDSPRVFSYTKVQKPSILWLSTFFIVQLSHPYMTPGKTIALTRQTFAGKVMSLLFNILSKVVITLERLYFGGLQNHCRWWLQP